MFLLKLKTQNPFLPALSLANPLCHHCSSLTPCPLSHSLLCPPSRSPSWVSYVSHYVCDRFVMAFLAAIPLVPKHLSRGLIGFVFWALFSLLCALGLLFFVFFFAFTFFPFQMQNPEPLFLSVSLCPRGRDTQITSLTISNPMIRLIYFAIMFFYAA